MKIFKIFYIQYIVVYTGLWQCVTQYLVWFDKCE
nr:MAG TPA: hypothetical protein [Caudoviricetes sp.]